MKILVAYASRHGATKGIAERSLRPGASRTGRQPEAGRARTDRRVRRVRHRQRGVHGGWMGDATTPSVATGTSWRTVPSGCSAAARSAPSP
jgi:hypothetical protein